MTRHIDRWESMYVRLLKLLVLAGVVSCLFFLLLNQSAGWLIDRCYITADYEQQRNQEYLFRLQSYLDKNQVAAGDEQMLRAWVNRQKAVSLQVYRDHELLFDSDDLYADDLEYGYPSWENFYILNFADGEAEVSIYGMYFFQLYNWAFVGELLLSFFLFVAIVLLGIRRTMRYIRKLGEEIEILEGGNLDYEITVMGQDELAALARSLDEMRRSFRHKVEQEAHLVQTNRRMITEMSHDLRTPLTSIMLYTEILKKYGCGQDKDEKLQSYIDKIEEKTARMKQMSDHLFEYALITGENEVELEEAVSVEFVFYDLLSETCAYLEQNGFLVSLELSWKEAGIRVNTDYLLRIMDNITSNLLKYADPSEPVRIHTLYTDREAGISVGNAVRLCAEKEDSTRIGLGNMKNMMAKMNGSCQVTEHSGCFEITLLFPDLSVLS